MKKILIVILLVVAGYLVYTYTQMPHEAHFEGDGHNHSNESTLHSEQSQSVGLQNNFSGVKEIDTTKSMFTWTAQKAVLKNWIDTGSVKAENGSINFTDGKITSGTVVIDMNSITSKTTGSGGGQEKLTTHLKSADFFDVVNNPKAIIDVKKVDGTMASGTLTIKNITKEVSFPLTYSEQNGFISATGTLTIDRSLFNVKFGSNTFFENLGDKAIDNMFTVDFTIVTK
jgi:polyisoprenoid-binding protein YceI